MSLDFDVNAFIQDQNLEIEDDVKLLLNADLENGSKKRKFRLESSDSESELEMMAYNEMMDGKEIQEKIYINRTDALESRLFDIQQDLDWIETLVITAKESTILSKEEISDDLKRELKFYEQALDAAKDAKVKIENAGLVFTRPIDYFAEMVKSDDHMKKVKQRLLDEAQALKASEMARKQREAKKVFFVLTASLVKKCNWKNLQREKRRQRMRLKRLNWQGRKWLQKKIWMSLISMF
jgi:rRNA-processing protein EBP2